jgi:crossover junction endodeoxyribonuclease RusA
MIRIVLPFPPSVNRLWRTTKGGGMYRSPEYAAWRKQAEWAVAGQVKGKKIAGEYTLEITAVKPDKRRRDLGNLEKAVSDILQHAKVIEDDYLCQEIHIRWSKTGPECEIILKEYTDGNDDKTDGDASGTNGSIRKATTRKAVR